MSEQDFKDSKDLHDSGWIILFLIYYFTATMPEQNFNDFID